MEDYPNTISNKFNTSWNARENWNIKRKDILKDSLKFYVPREGDSNWDSFKKKHSQYTTYEQYQKDRSEIVEALVTDYITCLKDLDLCQTGDKQSALRFWRHFLTVEDHKRIEEKLNNI